MKLVRLSLLAFLWLLAVPSHAERLVGELDKILDTPGLKGGIVGAEVARVSDGQVLYARNPDTRLMPASNRKLFTAAAALELLGDEFRLETDVRAAGGPDAAGVLRGDITLRGGGDGLLSVADLGEMARQVARAGVRRITGGVVGDGTLFPDGPYGEGWEWDDLSDDYAPQISALEVNEGIVSVRVAAGARAGDAATVTVDPAGYLPVANSARTMATGTAADVRIFRPYDAGYLVVTGILPIGGAADNTATVADPARFAATVFRQALIRQGVTVEGPAFSARSRGTGSLLLASHLSLPLAQYLAKMDKPSDNLLAESLWRVLGAEKGSGGTYAAGAAVARPFFQSLGLDATTLTLADGSGVSRRNFVTARAVTQLLVAMHGRPDWRAFYDSLPIAGVDGTLRRRMAGTPAAGNVHAKTGTLTGASCLSGYVTGRGGALYAFSLLMNNFPAGGAAARVAQDAFTEWLAAHL
ncbi:MAG: D-alanyl-D-alanine carboxypeptidase/D-alanyl-D-alanine-endopeptidase [Armatimonadetes bacterium]|nr:D-alanyl-D-alanine carboxypeptidase/D-alanyl-D-alanine-endopeptidase [Armatimonadota bacterium]